MLLYPAYPQQLLYCRRCLKPLLLLHTSKSPSILHPISNAAASGTQPAVPEDPAHLLQGDLIPLKEALRQFEAAYIQRALDQTGTLKEAADVLGISFSTLCRKKTELGISQNAGSGKKITGHTL